MKKSSGSKLLLLSIVDVSNYDSQEYDGQKIAVARGTRPIDATRFPLSQKGNRITGTRRLVPDPGHTCKSFPDLSTGPNHKKRRKGTGLLEDSLTGMGF
jgi:hypothetical protein